MYLVVELIVTSIILQVDVPFTVTVAGISINTVVMAIYGMCV